MSEQKRKWYAVYTKPRWEKKVHQLLQERGIEAYCPLNRVRKKWSDRIKWVQEPLFKSYVFVRLAEGEQTEARRVDGVLNFVYWLGKPAIVKEKEIETIQKFLNDYSDVQVEPFALRQNAHITISRGALMDQKARIVKVYNNKVQVIIESIGFSLIALVEKSNVVVHNK